MKITADKLTKQFATRSHSVEALSELTLEIPAGQFTAVRGASGSGKSTLLSLLGGLAQPTSGSVTIGDFEMSAASSSERAAFRESNIGIVFQLFHLMPYLNALQNVMVAAKKSQWTKDEERAATLLDQFGLEERHDHRPDQLSAGERQRVALARAVLQKPSVLLADEPTGNLDPKSADIVLDLIRDIHQQGSTVVLVTHDERIADSAERIIELEKGVLQS